MYTITIMILSGIAVCLCFWFRGKINFSKLFWITFLCTFYAYIEFIYFNTFRIKAWEFNYQHILGIGLFNTTIEDFIFAPMLTIILYLSNDWIDSRINSKAKVSTKGIHLLILFLISVFFLFFSGEFGRLLTVKMMFGIFCIVICFPTWDVRQFYVILGVNCLIAGAWDIWAANTEIQQWFYRDSNYFSQCYKNDDWWWFKIGKGWFPLSIFPYYYISSTVFFQGARLFINKILKLKQQELS